MFLVLSVVLSVFVVRCVEYRGCREWFFLIYFCSVELGGFCLWGQVSRL